MRKRTGQSTIEVVVLILIVAIAIFLMRAYVKRAMQGKLKSSADQIGTPWDYSDADSSTVVYHRDYTISANTEEQTTPQGSSITTYHSYTQVYHENVNAVQIDDFQNLTRGVD